MAVITLITGAPGSGKSYYIVYRLKQVLETMPELRVRTNLPLKLDEWGALASRIEKLETKTWRNDGGEGPWRHEEWRNYLLVLDECHNFICGEREKEWADWLGECRHRGVYGVWLLTQSQKKVEKLGDVGLWCEMQKPEEFRSRITGIPLGVWWQWLSLLRGQRYSLCCCYEYLDEKRRRQPNKIQWLPIAPLIYRLYESFSTPEKGGISGSCREPWQLGLKAVLLHSFAECWIGLTIRLLGACGFYIGGSVLLNLPSILMAGVKSTPTPKATEADVRKAFTASAKKEPARAQKAPTIEEAGKPAETKERGELRSWMQNLGKAETEDRAAKKQPAPLKAQVNVPPGRVPLSKRELRFEFSSGSAR